MSPEMRVQPLVEALTKDDIPAAMALKDALGWNQTPEDWERFLRLAPEGAFGLRAGEELAGTALAFVFEDVCWIGMVIVADAWRGCGYGNALMRRCLEHAESRRCTLVQLDATRDGVSLYARLGFRPVHLVGTCRGRIVPPEQQGAEEDPGGYTLAPVERGDLEEIVALEADALGANREALLRELTGSGGCGGRTCRGAKGELAGFLLYRPGHHSIQVGPLVAREEGAASAVLRSAFREICAQRPQCDVTLTAPLYNEAMVSELRRWGLPVTPRLTRMYRGIRRLQAREDMVYALSGPEKG